MSPPSGGGPLSSRIPQAVSSIAVAATAATHPLRIRSSFALVVGNIGADRRHIRQDYDGAGHGGCRPVRSGWGVTRRGREPPRPDSHCRTAGARPQRVNRLMGMDAIAAISSLSIAG
ncbi:hypothetical protein KCMC57_up15040 [Kitasatospora sp. CMC57]|uniref:Uncharacterized protein n=1 Tax=Kitasatospora sp. CMC57 TaxID=3231513 RepID=A0AB33JV07_9ACTN